MARKKRELGLGDVVESVTKATGLDKLVGDDCGCKERKEKLNSLLSFGKKIVNCPTEEQIAYIDGIGSQIRFADRLKIAEIYEFVYNTKIDVDSTCGECWLNHIRQIKRAV
jgi:hypothetical protein